MKNGKYTRRSSGTKALSVLLAVLVLVGCSVGATLAWMTAKTDEVKNTFTVGNIQISLDEHTYVPATNSLADTTTKANSNYKIVPGTTAPKDPFVTVTKGSEKCWLFVRIDEAYNDLDGHNNVVEWIPNGQFKDVTPANYKDAGIYIYCYEKPVEMNAAADQKFEVLNGNQVSFRPEITNDYISSVIAGTTEKPVLQFTAAAIQYDGFAYTVADPDVNDPQGVTWKSTVTKALNALDGDFLKAENLVTGAKVSTPTT